MYQVWRHLYLLHTAKCLFRWRTLPPVQYLWRSSVTTTSSSVRPKVKNSFQMGEHLPPHLPLRSSRPLSQVQSLADFLSLVNKIEPCFKQGHRSTGTINREKLRPKIDNMYLYSMKGVPLPLGRPSICRRGLRWAGLRLRGPCPRVVWAFPLPPPRCLSWGCRRSLSVRPCPTTVGPKRTTSWPFSTQSSSFTRGSFETATPYRKCRWTQPTPRVESSTATPGTEQPSSPSSLQRVIYGDDCQSLSRSLRYSKIYFNDQCQLKNDIQKKNLVLLVLFVVKLFNFHIIDSILGIPDFQARPWRPFSFGFEGALGGESDPYPRVVSLRPQPFLATDGMHCQVWRRPQTRTAGIPTFGHPKVGLGGRKLAPFRQVTQSFPALF